MSEPLNTVEEEQEPAHWAIARQAARDKYASEGSVEIDDNALVSEGDDPGCYVQAWVWVDSSSYSDLSPEDDEEG